MTRLFYVHADVLNVSSLFKFKDVKFGSLFF